MVATAILITAYNNAIIGKHYSFAAAIAVAWLGITAIASGAGMVEVNAAALAEPALVEMQERIGGRLRTDSMRIARFQPGIQKRHIGATVMFGLAILINISALLYAVIHLSNPCRRRGTGCPRPQPSRSPDPFRLLSAGGPA